MKLLRTLLLSGSCLLASAGSARAADVDVKPASGDASVTGEPTDGPQAEDAGEEPPVGIQPTTTPDNLGCAASPAGREGMGESVATGLAAGGLAVVAIALGRRSRRTS